MKLRSLLLAATTLASLATVRAQDTTIEQPKLQAEAKASLAKGAGFLISRQGEDGMFGPIRQPAIAALGAMALHDLPTDNAEQAEVAALKALDHVVSLAQKDGGIYDPGARSAYHNYNTAICLLAISEFNRPQDREVALAARAYLKRMQIDDPDSPNHGGFSYGGKAGGRTDMSNSAWVAEALKKSEVFVEDTGDAAAEAENSAMWNSVQTFLAQTQKTAEPGDEEPDSDVGGFAYRPSEDVSDLVTTGTMTYAGLKTMLYARLQPNDARVKSVLDYVSHHYTVSENPGAGQIGYYYYVITLAKALDAYGADAIEMDDGRTRRWRSDLAYQLMSLQQDDGSWVNSEGRFMESSPDLVTPYAMIALRLAAEE